MDMEKPSEITLLARELKEHGIACSLDEAEQKAQSIIMTTKNKKEEPDEKIQLLEQRYKFLLNSQNQKFSEEISGLKNTLDSVSSELIELRKQFNEQRQAIEQKPKAGAQQEITDIQEKKKEATAGSKEKEKAKEELNPGDISIEKFFYCGQK